MHRIGYDAKRLFNNFTGLGNYSRTLLDNLAAFHPDEAYFLYTPEVVRNERTQFFLDSPMFTVRMPTKGRRLLWRSWRETANIVEDKIDLFHGLSHEIPIGLSGTGIPSVVTIHDLIFRHYPEQYAWADRQIYDWKFRYACENSDLVIAISQSTKQDIMTFYGIPEEKIVVIYQSCHEGFMVEKSESVRLAVREKYGLPNDYMLSVGSLIERKNLLGIVEAMAQLPADLNLPLAVVGNGSAYQKKVVTRATELGILDRLHFIQPDFEEFPALYQGARLFVYPSYCEGFGIPVLEALFSRTPVITSNVSSLPEAAGPGAYLVDPSQPADLAQGMIRLLTDEALRTEKIEAGYQHAQQFTADILTEQLVNVYQRLLKV
jgi:glycosyltransferase involved in cell wall biosynthesis